MKLQSFNYHTHTYICGHAIGTAEDMILAAIQGGFKTIGISEHIGHNGWDDPKDRLNFKDNEKYLEMMYALKEKYKDKINVRVGFECELYEENKQYLLKIKDACDYMICGQHTIAMHTPDLFVEGYSSDENIEKVADIICEGIELGLFKYIAHPDYFLLGKCAFTPRKKAAIRKIAQCCKAHDVVIEINLKGCKYGKHTYDGIESYMYPNSETFKIVGEVGAKVCFGYDAHHPDDLVKRRYLENEMKEAFKAYNLHFVEDLEL